MTINPRSAIFEALINDEDDPRAYQSHVLSSLHGWLKRNMPEARKMIFITSGQSPDMANKLYRQLLLPRIVKWDFPHHFTVPYHDMIRDLLKTIEQRSSEV